MALHYSTHFAPSNSPRKFFSGIGGRVFVGLKEDLTAVHLEDVSWLVDYNFENTSIAAWVRNWSFESSVEVMGADTFENPANLNLKPFKRKDLLGLASGKVDLDGYTAVNAGRGSLNNPILVGNFYILELNMGRTTPGGGQSQPQSRRIRCVGLCASKSFSASADGNSPQEFKASFELASPPVIRIINDQT